MKIEINNKYGKRLKTSKTIVEEDIEVVPVLQDLTITENGTYPVGEGYAGIGAVTVEVESSGALPIEISTEAEMKALLESGEVGGVYKYTGETGTYENGALYLLEYEDETYLTFSSPNSFTLNIVDNKKYWDGTLEYSTDLNTWSEWDGTTTLSADNGKLYMRGTGNTYITGETQSVTARSWRLTGSEISCIGNIENLLDYATVASGKHPSMADYCYQGLFGECTSLITAPKLPATTLTDYCYRALFFRCKSLITAPELPATTLTASCYVWMFDECMSLKTAPKLPATTLATFCYSRMFEGCTGLTIAPELPATTLTASCYRHMFDGCTSLKTAPKLPATTLADYCYWNMFDGCTSLITIPKLPATTLADYCYGWMFTECTSIKLSTEQSDEYPTPYRIPASGTGTTATSSLIYMFTATGGAFKGAPALNTTYYLHSSNSIV